MMVIVSCVPNLSEDFYTDASAWLFLVSIRGGDCPNEGVKRKNS
jgi:hypothetical protein